MTADKATLTALEVVRQLVDANYRALRGHDDYPGLIAKVDELSKEVRRITTNDIPHLKAELLDEIRELQEKSVTWPGLGKGLLGPVFVSIVTAILVTLAHRIFFP